MSEKKMNLYQCTQLFAETMREQYDNPGECAIVLIATDGKKITKLINGSDSLLKRAITHVSMDDETRSLIAQAVMDAVKEIKRNEGTVL